MILIKEKETNKLPGSSSLFVSFDYNADIVDAIKTSTTNAIYDKKTKMWEVSVTNLATLLDKLYTLDDIKLVLKPDEDKREDIQYKLKEFKTKPFKYQLEGINYGLNHDNWLLLDAPGLGKTLQLIYLAEELKDRYNIEHCFIICGINTLKTNWQKEIKKHSDLSCRILGQRVTKSGKIVIGSVAERAAELKSPIDEFFVITNIETIRNEEVLKALQSDINHFDMMVVDEIHTCKSPTSQQGKHLLKLNKSKYKIGATGTLLLNNPLDAFVPLKWIGAENSTYTNFKYYYCNYGGDFHNMLLGFKNIDVLKDTIERHSLRRTKDLLELPPKTIINEYIDMNPNQELFYNNIKRGIVSQVDLVHMSTANLLAMVARLRQATACPSILTSENIYSSKIERAVDLIHQIVENGDKVVVFSTFKDTLNYIYEDVKQYNATINTGDINDSEISKNIDEFQNSDKSKVFLATWQKMGTGITLNAASYAIFIDTPWTSSAYLQAQDRIYRIGTNKPVIIYNLICKDTIDERVLEIIEDKEAISDYIVDDKISDKSINSLRKYIEELAQI